MTQPEQASPEVCPELHRGRFADPGSKQPPIKVSQNHQPGPISDLALIAATDLPIAPSGHQRKTKAQAGTLFFP